MQRSSLILWRKRKQLSPKGECASLSSSYSSPAWQPILWQLIPESFITNLFRETLRLLFAVVIAAVTQFSLFPYLLGRAEKAKSFIFKALLFSGCQKFYEIFQAS